MPEQARVQAFTLVDGGQPAERTANALAHFVKGAKQSLEIAIYDLRLPDPIPDILRDETPIARAGGATIRLVYNEDDGVPRVPVPPPPQTQPDLLSRVGFPIRG